MSVHIETDSAQLEAQLTEAAERQPEVVRQWKTEGSLRVMEEMRARTPIRTGFLRESITTAETPDGFMVYPAASYAPFVEGGTQPHTIFPVSARVLRWFGAWGTPMFATHVHHPGTAGRFFVRDTFEAVKLELQKLYGEILERVLG